MCGLKWGFALFANKTLLKKSAEKFLALTTFSGRCMKTIHLSNSLYSLGQQRGQLTFLLVSFKCFDRM